jgi:hypothetical protein
MCMYASIPYNFKPTQHIPPSHASKSHESKNTHLADCMSLASLALQTVLLVAVVLVAAAFSISAAVRGRVGSDVFLGSLQLSLVHVVEHADAELDVGEQGVASALGEVLADNDTQHLQVVGVWRHGVGGDDPAALAELVCERKLVVVTVFLAALEAEGHEWESGAVLLRHDLEVKLLERLGEIVSGACEVGHDGAVSALAKTDQLVVLADDLRGALGEVESEGSLVGTEVVDVEDKFLREELRCTPNDPANTWVDESISRRILVGIQI